MKLTGSTGRKNVIVSSALVALALAAVIDVIVAETHPLASINTVNIDRGEPYNAVKAILADNKKHDRNSDTTGGVDSPRVILLGSSLMVAPTLQAEAEFQKQPLKRFHQRNLDSFAENLNAAIKNESNQKVAVRSYLLAVGGEMASDALILLKALTADSSFAARNADTYVVYGIAPRDFHDNLFPRVDASASFKTFADLTDLPALFAAEPSLTDVDKLSACGERLSSLYRYRNDWQNLVTIKSKRVIEKCIPAVVFDKYSDSLTLKPTKRGLLPGEAVGTPLVVPGAAVDHSDWQTTAAEYRKRYLPASESRLNAQIGYFEQLLSHCKKHDIQLLVVNMPLSQDNMKILPSDFYAGYLARTTALCARYDVEYKDLNQGAMHDNSNFVDSVHLKPSVSSAFMRELAGLVARSNLSLAMSAQDRANSRSKRRERVAAPAIAGKARVKSL